MNGLVDLYISGWISRLVCKVMHKLLDSYIKL